MVILAKKSQKGNWLSLEL